MDTRGNLYVSDHWHEVAGNGRLLMFSADTFPATPAVPLLAPNATKEFPRSQSFATWQPAFDSTNRMVVGYNPYLGKPYRRVQYFNDPTGSSTTPDGQLNDFDAWPIAATFDAQDNLYIYEANRGQVRIYWTPFRGAPSETVALGTVTSGLAYNFDEQRRGFGRMSGEFASSGSLDLGAPSVEATVLSLLREEGGGELSADVPIELIARTRSQRVTVFETPPGTTPFFRLTVRTCIPALEGCPNSRGLDVGEYEFTIEAINGLVTSPTQCGPAPGPGATAMTTRFRIDDKIDVPVVVVVEDRPWSCSFRNGRPALIRVP
jgi:hypothetical protein